MWLCTSHNISVLTVHGLDNGQFNFPITVDGEGNFLVTDIENITFRSLKKRVDSSQEYVPKVLSLTLYSTLITTRCMWLIAASSGLEL